MKKTTAWLLALFMALSAPLAAAKQLTKRSYIDCRHCLDLPTTEEIIKCAEKYM